MRNLNKILDSFEEKKMKKKVEVSPNNESSNASASSSTASKSKEDTEPSADKFQEDFDIKKTIPFLELEQNLTELEDDEVVFKSRSKY